MVMNVMMKKSVVMLALALTAAQPSYAFDDSTDAYGSDELMADSADVQVDEQSLITSEQFEIMKPNQPGQPPGWPGGHQPPGGPGQPAGGGYPPGGPDHGGPGGPDHGGPMPHGFVCYARGRFGRTFEGFGWFPKMAQEQAMRKCERYLRRCRPLGCDFNRYNGRDREQGSDRYDRN